MLPQRWWARWLGAATLAAAGAALVHGRGVAGAPRAETLSRGSLRLLGFTATGDAALRLEGDHALAWALERSRPGPAGPALARGDGGAVRWRVSFAGGGEGVVTSDGSLWSIRRPVPTDPGADLFPAQARELAERVLAGFVPRPGEWRRERSQTWREEGATWYRTRFVETAATLPPGWRRELEIDAAGSTAIAVRTRVHPLGTDLGVAMGRIAELAALRQVGVVGVAILVLAMLLAGVEAFAYHEPVAVARGGAAGVAVAGCAWVAGQPLAAGALQGVVAAAAVALLPTWASLVRSRPAWGPAAGLALAVAVLAAPSLVAGFGGWLPRTPALPEGVAPLVLAASAWLPALAEEPLLRGAVPGLLGPVLGWWGGALAGACLGALFHPLPAVPLAASLAVELAVQLGLVAVARVAGVGGAVMARGVLGSVVLRSAFPLGPAFDAAALAGVAVGAAMILLRRERE
jgi:hypothetical protein